MDRFDITTDAFCAFYDELPLWSAPFARLLLEHVPLRAGMRILDVGAGTGFLAMELAERCGSSSSVVAVDPWSAALRRLEAKRAYLGLSNLQLVDSTLEEARLSSGAFDLVVSNLGINNFAAPQAALAECERVLRPGGMLLMSTNLRGHMAEFYAAYRATLSDLGLLAAMQRLDEHIAGRASEESIEELMRGAGLLPGRSYRDHFTMRFADGTALFAHHLIRVAFLPDWMEVCPEPRRREVFDMLEARLNALAAASGALALTIPMLCVEANKPTAGQPAPDRKQSD